MRSPKHKLTKGVKGWQKKINGKTRWIASFREAPTGAVADSVYERKFTELWQEPPRQPVEVLLVADLGDRFLFRKQQALDAGHIGQRTFDDCKDACQDFLDSVGSQTPAEQLGPQDFDKFRMDISARFGPDRLKKWLINVRSMFKYAVSNRLITRPPVYGDAMMLPTKSLFRKHRAKQKREHGSRIFTAEEIEALLNNAGTSMKAMILLGLIGFGNTDLASIPRDAIDLDKGMIDFARPKTGVDRRSILWPEHVEAIRNVVTLKRKAADKRHAGLLFLTRFGLPYACGVKDQISFGFRRLTKKCGLVRTGRSFYSLRRTFRTVADEAGDQRAIALMMGHETTDVGTVYVQHISNERLKAVSDHVRSKLISSKVADNKPASSDAGAVAVYSKQEHPHTKKPARSRRRIAIAGQRARR